MTIIVYEMYTESTQIGLKNKLSTLLITIYEHVIA